MMGNPSDDETVLFLFIAFAISIVLLLLLVLISCQTWMLWKMAHAVVEQDGSWSSRKRRGCGKRVSGKVEGKWRITRSSVYGIDEAEQLMSGGNGGSTKVDEEIEETEEVGLGAEQVGMKRHKKTQHHHHQAKPAMRFKDTVSRQRVRGYIGVLQRRRRSRRRKKEGYTHHTHFHRHLKPRPSTKHPATHETHSATPQSPVSKPSDPPAMPPFPALDPFDPPSDTPSLPLAPIQHPFYQRQLQNP
jgi:hypothetical protein